jgi:uncharacterized membrane protein
MTRHRLELFSDGVLAFVLILLALDLRPPHLLGMTGFLDAAPPFFVHAAAFALVAFLWMALHDTFALVGELRPQSLMFKILALCWLTAMPFAAKIAAQHPMDPLGPSLLAACYGLFTASNLGLRLTSHGALDEPPAARRWFEHRLWQYGALAALRLALAALAWVSPWFGYAALATVVVGVFLGPTPLRPADPRAQTGREGPEALST